MRPGVTRSLTPIVVAACMYACGGDGGQEPPPDPDAGDRIDAKSMTIDAQSFPAVCQELPLRCPDAASLATCEDRDAHAFSLCEYLPITEGCVADGCPSAAQVCRRAESPLGHCTHSCTDDSDCVADPPSLGATRCLELDFGVKTCVID